MSNTQARAPLVWILKGPKAGDYAQLQSLARALGVSAVTKQLVFRPWELLLHARPRPTLAALDRDASDPLEPPWPRIVLTAGRRNELVACWIRDASAGSARLIHVGRPWSNPGRFDLVVSNRQYLLSASDNVIVNDLPLTDLTADSLADERCVWGAKWAHLPHPWTVVLVGGDSGPLVFSPEHAQELARQINARVARRGGSVLLTTSGRTPPRSADALLRALQSPAFVHRWPSSEANPYRGLLACGDEFIVTADSMSMLAESCATGKPVYLFDYSDEARGWRTRSAYRWKPFVHRLAMSIGPVRMRRDLRRIHTALLDAGRIRRLGSADDEATLATSRNEDLARTIDRVRALLGD
jgi:mitochondrial fission protein ELM1